MNPATEKTRRLAIHSTHEAAKKIAGIGAVLDGILPDPAYKAAFRKTVLVGPWPFAEGRHPLKTVHFDSTCVSSSSASSGLPVTALKKIADDFGARIVFGTREIRGVEIDVLLAQPSGIHLQKVIEFQARVKDRFGFDMGAYAERYCAIEYRPDESLTRLLRAYRELQTLKPGDSFENPPHLRPENALCNDKGQTFYGGVPFVNDGATARAAFPSLAELDSFAEFERANHYLIELQFYFFPAPALWAALRILIDQEPEYECDEITFFSHDWMGVPLFWAMDRSSLGNLKLSTVYFAHETRLCRMLIEGNIKDKMGAIEQDCHPDGHDVAFYSRLAELEKSGFSGGLDAAFKTVKDWIPPGSPFRRAFQDIYYHELNSQVARFEKIVVVGKNVERETRLILADWPTKPPISVCPNGVPNFIHTRCAKVLARDPSPGELKAERKAANSRLKQFASKHFGFSPNRPIYLVSSVSRCELSKAPWRNLEFFKAFAANLTAGEQALFIWLSRPRPLPTSGEIAKWQQESPVWPLTHRPKASGGDLREEEESLWEMISAFNQECQHRRILYVNQFGWDSARLGTFDLGGTTFDDLRIGTDVELGLSVYEPFGIAPLEPFGSGTICVLSDACGCAVHLQQLADQGTISRQGFVVGAFAQTTANPSSVKVQDLKRIEDGVYEAVIPEVLTKLAVPQEKRLEAAQKDIKELSWDVSSKNLLKFLV